jgi:ring-1,2-phenylacetyl-CoA epoxidase subunit PaaB
MMMGCGCGKQWKRIQTEVYLRSKWQVVDSVSFICHLLPIFMNDTQWQRYEVFKQDSPKKAHEAIGSVHAPDAEVAMLNARHVHVRRPNAVSLWVVAESDILSLTAQEIAENEDWWMEEATGELPQTFHIFTKTTQRRSMTFVKHVGDEVATSSRQALRQAMDSGKYDHDSVYVWWVVPDDAINRSDPAAVDTMFAPAKEKKYRQQTNYGFVGERKRK